MAKRHLIIDGDIPLYSIGFSIEEPVDWGNDFWTLHADMQTAREAMVIWVDKLCEATKTKEVVVALSSSDNWRKDLYPLYKANRAGKRKPVVYNPLKDFIFQRWEVVLFPRLEADDVLGILSKTGKTYQDILVSSDKDLKCVPGRHFDPDRPEDGIRRISPVDAYKHSMVQALTGDSTDNYKGCPGVGPVAAEKILKDLEPGEMWEAVVARYAKSGLTEEEAMTQAMLAHILLPGETSFAGPGDVSGSVDLDAVQAGIRNGPAG